jgi:TonB family protein
MSRTDAWKAWEGRVVDGKFSLRQWLGGSDHSAVFLTERPGKPSEKAAIKLMDWNGGDAESEVARLESVSKLSHPHLISAYAAGRCNMDGIVLAYAVMELADEDLSQILPQRALTPAEVRDMLPPVLDGLSYLHSNGLVHSRMKPSNVLAAGDQLKLSTDQVTATGRTPARRKVGVYDAPEVANGEISPAADIWSLGVTIITALTQQANPAGSSSQRDAGGSGNIPEPFRSMTRECLNIDPQQRCSLQDIRNLLQTGRQPVPTEPSHAGEKDSSRLPAYAIPLVLAVLALAAWGLFHSRGKDSTQNQATAPLASTPRPAQPPVQPKPSPSAPSRGETKGSPSVAGGGVVHEVIPDVPQSAKNTIRGTIKISVQVQVDPSGQVSSARLKSSGPSRYFAERALKAAQQWKFSPPETSGEPTSSAWLIQFRFKRSGIQASPQRLPR